MRLIKGQYYWIRFKNKKRIRWFPARYTGNKTEPTSWDTIGTDWGLPFESVEIGLPIKIPKDS